MPNGGRSNEFHAAANLAEPRPLLEVAVMFWCWLAIHTWTRWEDKHDGEIKQGEDLAGHYFIQERRCSRCNIAQWRQEER